MADCKRSAYTLEIKSMQADGTFAGYASVFHMVDSQRDIVRPGAFAESLKKRKHPLQLLWQHQWDSPIGVIAQIFEDKHGLYVEGKLLLDVARAREAYALLKAGAIRGLSIGFTVQKAKQNIDTGTRELLQVDLWEVSLVTLPANEAAQVTVVKLQALAKEHAALDKAERSLADMRKRLANGHAMPIGWEKTKRISDQFFIKAAAVADDSEAWNGEDDGDFDEDDEPLDPKTEKRAQAIYGETSGLTPKLINPKVSPYKKSNWEAKSAERLHAARTFIGIISERNPLVHFASPTNFENSIQSQVWVHSVEAAMNAANSTLLDPHVTNFFLRQDGVGRQVPPWPEFIRYESLGPFNNVGGGDVPIGPNTYIDFYGKPAYRRK